jgi:hypothetical protein
MPDFIVHTQKKDPDIHSEIHFFYRVKSSCEEQAYPWLQEVGAIDWGEDHIETFPIPNDANGHELIAIFKRQ